MTNETIIEELNTLLRGTYMGIRSLEHYIQKTDHPELKENFQHMQQEVKQNAQKLAERIQNLGGVPADGEGFTGTMHSYMHKLMVSRDETKMIEDAIYGMENYGVEYSEELVKGDLDETSRQLAEEVIGTSRKHAEELRHLLQT
jgi:bacterioferritin